MSLMDDTTELDKDKMGRNHTFSFGDGSNQSRFANDLAELCVPLIRLFP